MILITYLYGVTSMGSFVIALFFLRYYRMTKDELFIWFSLAFFAFAANWSVLAISWEPEATHLIYILRLVGFALLATGILRKNRAPRQGSS